MSASPEPARRPEPAIVSSATGVPRWRLVVIGLVAVLAVGIGLAAGSFLLTTRVAALGGGASYVPPTAAMYFEMRLSPSVAQDEALRDLLGRFPRIDGLDLDRPLFDQLGEVLDAALAEDGADVSWSDDIAPWFDGHVALGLIDMPASAFDPTFNPMAPPEAPRMVVLFGVTDADAARAAVERLATESAGSGSTFTTTEHRGVTVHAADGFGEGAWAVTGDQVLLAPTADDIVAALDTNAEGPSVAGDDELQSLAGRLPDDWVAFATYDFTEMMAAAMEAAAPTAGASLDALGPLLEHQPLRGAFAMRATEDGLAFDAVSAAPTGPFAVENADRGLADEVPADALYYAEGGSLGPALAAFITSMKQSLASEPEAADGIATAEAALGADLEELVAWIGDGAMAVGWDGSQPYGGLVLAPDDRSAAERRLGQLATFARLAATDPASGIAVSEREVAGVSITTIRWADPAMFLVPGADEMALVVEYALSEDRALVGFGDRFVARALELDPAAALGAEARYADSLTGLGGPAGTGIAWMDLAGIVEAVEAAFATELADPAYRSDVRPWLLPWDRIVGVSRMEDGLHVQRSVLLIR